MADDARDRILEAAVALRLLTPGGGITVEAVANKADCAKGLVSYHFKSKNALFSAADEAIAQRRTEAWLAALKKPDPQAAIDAVWTAILMDAESGVALHAGSHMTDWSDSEAFPRRVGRASVRVLARAGRRPSVSVGELEALCGVTLPGFASALAAGATARDLEGAYAGFWAALFALTADA